MKDIIVPEVNLRPEQVMPPITSLPEPTKLSEPETPKQPELSRPTKKNPLIAGVRLTDEQWATLRSGGYIFVENMEKRDGSGRFSEYLFMNDEKDRVLSCRKNPDEMVEYGGVTVRLRDKILVEKGYVVKAKMKWWGGIDFQHPFVWKDPECEKIEYSFTDPRTSKEQIEKDKQELENRFRRLPAVKRTPPVVNRTPPPKRNVSPPTKGPKNQTIIS